jgi:hypothetical protein
MAVMLMQKICTRPLYPDLISVGIVSAASDAVALTETPLFVLMATRRVRPAGSTALSERPATPRRGLILFLSGLLKVCPG